MQHLILLLLRIFYVSFSQPPNILFIYVDDVGFNDFGFNQNTDTQTPFIDNLVKEESLLIERNYVSFVCSPTRAQMLSGRYASHLGLQHSVFTENAPYSLTRQVSLLSNEFQSNGYSTHLIGKFHLGFQAWEYTPLYRGFDTFAGFYNGEETYFSHMAYLKDTDLMYYDLRSGNDEDSDVTDYSVYMQRDKFLTLLDEIHTSPFFIYLSFQAAHFPPQAPDEYASLYCDIKSKLKPPYKGDDDASNGDIYLSGDCTSHHMHMAQMTSIDDAMQVIVDRMKSINVWDNTLVIFSSDNGAVMFSGDNAPLRGGKTTPFEGGVRVPGFITGGLLNEDRRGAVLSGFPVHVTDWYKTLLSAANLEVTYKRSKKLYGFDDDILDTKWDYIEENEIEIGIDGKDLWNAIQNGVVSDELTNREVLLHLDEIECSFEACGALLFGEWKWMIGPYICDGSTKCGWNNAFMTDPTANVLGCAVMNDEIEYDYRVMTCFDGCLFNLENDPCEMTDVKNDNPQIVEIMQNKLLMYQQQSVMPLMGENQTYLSNDEIDPTIVCDSEYWCPYMEYDNVEFEQVLYGEYMRIYGSDNQNKMKGNVLFAMDENSLLRILALFTLFGIICAFYNKCKRYRLNDIKDVRNESSPLL